MKTLRRSPFMEPMASFSMALATFIGIASFINLKDKEEENDSKEDHEERLLAVRKSFFKYVKQARFASIIFIFILLFLEEDE